MPGASTIRPSQRGAATATARAVRPRRTRSLARGGGAKANAPRAHRVRIFRTRAPIRRAASTESAPRGESCPYSTCRSSCFIQPHLRVTETLGEDWCGPSPRCPYRHWLQAKTTGPSPATSTAKSVCTFSSSGQASFPWPWFNEFALEATLLRRWRSDLLTSRTRSASSSKASGDECAADADVVVVPSLYFHSTGLKAH